MILHLLRMRRNVNRNVFNDWKNVSAAADLASDIVDDCWLWPRIRVTCVFADWRISAWFESECSIGATHAFR
jgi:hypothetical protein